MKWNTLKEERRAAGVTDIRELATEAGLRYETLSDVESGLIGVDEETQMKLRTDIATIAARKAERAAEMAAA